MFAIEHYGVSPDIMIMAKAIGGGVPISAVMTTEEIAVSLEPMDFFSTYGGNPLVCAAAIAAIEVVLNEDLVQRSEELGGYFMGRLKELAEQHGLIGDVRGSGLLIGVEMVKDHKTKEPAIEESVNLRQEARKRGVILAAGWGWLGNVIRVTPPAVITREQIDKSVEVINESLKVVEEK